MVLEATMIVLDNSEWMRNGDFTPTRLEAQADTLNILFRSKTGSNPENTVGVLSMANKGPEVLVTLTTELGKVLSAVHRMKLGGQANFTTGVQVAQLALKHRQNKNQRQRIVVFTGSPIYENEKELVKLGKKLKKNNVAVDVINFGEVDNNTPKLQAFIEAVNSSANSNLLTVYPGAELLSDAVLASPIIPEDGSGVVRSSNDNFEFGVDPSVDPELAMALRISLEEERARQESLNANNPNKSEESKEAPAQSTSAPQEEFMEYDEEAELKQALAMSLQMMEEEGDNQPSGGAELDDIKDLPGVDIEDPKVQEAMGLLKDYDGNDKDKKKKDNEMED
ncbi:hypothetical protein K502DRAFT_323517 [Neoconidiobolus thromboides FSU 785]|nr:hypothetical protein K502DRAFT_323517 [Neoconidiobolus thromboides FSU 785]